MLETCNKYTCTTVYGSLQEGGGRLGNKKRVGENDSKLDSDEREEQPGEVVRSSGWFCTEDKAKVLRH